MFAKWFLIFTMVLSSNSLGALNEVPDDFDDCCVEDFDLDEDCGACVFEQRSVQKNYSVVEQISQKLQQATVICMLKYYEAKGWCSRMLATALHRWAQFQKHAYAQATDDRH